MLRITRDDTERGTVLLKLEGRLTQDLVDFLVQECSALHGRARPVVLNLSGVAVVDRAGVEALRRLQSMGCAIRGCSDLIASILEAEGILVDRGLRER